MVKILFFTLSVVFIFGGCTAKEINNNVDSITSDISNAFENSKDKSAQ